MGEVLFPKRSRTFQTAGGAACVRSAAEALVVAAPIKRYPERSRGIPMRKLKGNLAGFLDSASDEPALCFGVPRFACLKVAALIVPRATAAATSLRRRLHFHRRADLDV